MKFYLGVDAGGTHTRFIMFDSSGQQVDAEMRESIHYMRVGYDGMKRILVDVKAAYEAKGYNFEEVGVAFGMAGYGENVEIRNAIEETVWSVFPNAYITNDARFAMTSALENQDGVFIISGTGSIAFRKLDCAYDRRGGFGYLIGDEGSAFWIGKRLLEIFTKEADGRLPRTDFYEGVINHFGITQAYDLVALANENLSDYRTWVAQMSLVGSRSQSPRVREVFEEAGSELAALANSFELNGKTPIALGGSVLIHNETVRDTLVSKLKDDYEYIQNNHPVEYAAYLLLKQ